MFSKVLVANRGEIAVRIFRSLKAMGIRSVAVYSDADVHALHVATADEALALGGMTAAESYLRIDLIIDLATAAGVQAIHPGYGFLSENAQFAEACEAAGIAFIGPTSHHIHEFGLKHRARQLAENVALPCTAGTGLLATVEEAVEQANAIGYPVILKNTGGGGGIGIQVCRSKEDLEGCFEALKRIGEQQFSNAGLFLEQYIEHGRHVEVQIFGDGRGGIAVLGDRDCSVQRRNQKIIEEAPAPNIPEATRAAMHSSAKRLGESVAYRSAGTVEFIYDFLTDKFYFLEVNTRIQVEHTITEAVTGLDIVECMIRMANDPQFDVSFMNAATEGVAIEVRINAEDPIHGFKPCPGLLKEVYFPTLPSIRIDTGVETGSEVSVFYDSMVAKIIAKGPDRATAISIMLEALSQTSILGIVCNIDYLSQLLRSEAFGAVKLSTKFLEGFHFAPSVIEVIHGGSYTTIQDYPGRIKAWAVGVPPSGPMDDYSFRLANRLLGNDSSMAGLECTLIGPTLLFHQDAVIALTGGKVSPTLNGLHVPMYAPVLVRAGQTLIIGKVASGVRSYFAIQGGIDSPVYLGSRSTFVLGKFGGVHGDGATLKAGDLVPVSKLTSLVSDMPAASPELAASFAFPRRVEVGVLYGPHGAPDFFTEDAMQQFFSTDYEVHYNASRLGVRLTGPKPTWTRADGGEAGLHPSNVHDCEYAIGSVNFTGDTPVILTCDGPSLGGFVCNCTIVKAELWKIGQVKPGDHIRFVPIDFETAMRLEADVDASLQMLSLVSTVNLSSSMSLGSCILKTLPAEGFRPLVVYRQAGDSNILLEYGEMELSLALRVRIYCLMQALATRAVAGIIELSPGVRSVQIQYDHRVVRPDALLQVLVELETTLPDPLTVDVPSRVIQLPMTFEDSATLDAVHRYKSTVKANAPWLPNNVDFIQRINGLPSRDDVSEAIAAASYLVLGLGDVYLGAPCAVPLDPRHRLLTSKYNPARTYTAEGTVGIGGIYMCVYGMDSPGGYQLVGRTIPVWNRDRKDPEPWLLKPFDQVSFYYVPEDELLKMRGLKDKSSVIKTSQSVFNLASYNAFLAENKESIDTFRAAQKVAFDEEVKLWSLDAIGEGDDDEAPIVDSLDADHISVTTTSYGCVWKILVSVGDKVSMDQEIVVLEAMKMETKVCSPAGGVVVSIACLAGKMVKTGDLLLVIKPVGTEPGAAAWIVKLDEPMVEKEVDSALSFAVKDNIDVAGVPTTAACPEFSYIPVNHSTVVAKLLASGAKMYGKTNLDQFACGLNGTRSPYGAVENSFNPEYVSGGSSSGSAYVVATGQVDFALGTDTAGSGRVPAMLNNIVGLKPSKGLISTKGVVPAAASVDCVSIFARTVDCAWTVLMQAKGYDSTDVFSKDMKLKMATLKPKFRFGVPDELKFFGDALSEKAFEEALLSLEAMGGERVVIEYKPLANVAAMLYEDAFVAERYSAIREFFDKNESVVIEPVRSIIAKGRNYGAVDLYDAQLKLLQAARKVQPMWATIDIMVVPTAPTHYKTVDMLADPVGLNRNLGTYTNFVNLLDYCAISIPSCIREDGLPFGITLIGQSGDDYTIAELGQRYHHSRGLFAGATGVPLGEPLVHLSSLSVKETVQIAVVGAHLEGMPLHHQLTSKNATFVRKCRTAAEYKLFAIANSTPPKPALVHVGPGEGASIEIEIYELSFSAVGEFLTQIPAPLGLGTLLADDGASVKGFIAEPRAMVGAVDITSYGGWRAYIFRSNEEEHKAV